MHDSRTIIYVVSSSRSVIEMTNGKDLIALLVIVYSTILPPSSARDTAPLAGRFYLSRWDLKTFMRHFLHRLGS